MGQTEVQSRVVVDEMGRPIPVASRMAFSDAAGVPSPLALTSSTFELRPLTGALQVKLSSSATARLSLSSAMLGYFLLIGNVESVFDCADRSPLFLVADSSPCSCSFAFRILRGLD